MRAILGIDAAWTEHGPSGVALIEGEQEEWGVVCAAPSYETFVACSHGNPIDWQAPKYSGTYPDIKALIQAARTMTSAEISVAALDIPVANVPFENRQAADSDISQAFGARACSTHTPNADRPGPISRSLTNQLKAEGFPLATRAPQPAYAPCAIDVYPHPALLALLDRDYRIPYEASKSLDYWSGTYVSERIANLLIEYGQINSALGNAFNDDPLDLPNKENVRTLASLKRYEDALDALICAWVGLRFAHGAAVSYGDGSAAIWVPEA